MRVQVIGAGSEENVSQGLQSLIVWVDRKGFLINCGYTVFPTLLKNRLINKVDRVFVSNRESYMSGSLDAFFKYRKEVLGKKTKFYGFDQNMSLLGKIDVDYVNNPESYFILDEKDSIITMPVNYKPSIFSEAFYNYGLLYSGPCSESLLETSHAFDARIIIHDVTFGDPKAHVDFSILARASDIVRKKTWLIGYPEDTDGSFTKKALQFGFAGVLRAGQTINI